MFALLAPAGFAVVVGLKAKLDAHAQWKAAQQRQKKASELRGAAAGALPDAELEEWRQKAMLATERLKGLETLVQVRACLGPRVAAQAAGGLSGAPCRWHSAPRFTPAWLPHQPRISCLVIYRLAGRGGHTCRRPSGPARRGELSKQQLAWCSPF